MSGVKRGVDVDVDVEFYEPPVHMFAEDEGLCMDHFIMENEQEEGVTQRFCKLFKVCAAVKSVGRVIASHESSPSKPFELNPKLNGTFVVDSIFRILRSNNNMSYEYGTGWMAAPGKVLSSGRMAYYLVSVCHLFKDWENSTFFGCFGGNAKEPNDFFGGHGFPIRFSAPLFYTEELEEADICVIRFTLAPDEAKVSIPESVSYLLPCALDSYTTQNGMASFGYPGVKAFLLHAERELLLGCINRDDELCLWDRYKACFNSKSDLLNAIRKTLQHLRSGVLCCSPASFRFSSGNFVYFDSSTLPGCSGSPVMTNVWEGYAVGTFKGTTGAGYDVVNRATSHDFSGFVRFYEKEILPMIPHHIHRDATAFITWIDKHNLDWPNRQPRKSS